MCGLIEASSVSFILMRIVLSGGGTGGHLFPLVAIGNALREHFGPTTELYFIGAKSPWLPALRQEGITTIVIPAGKIHRYVTPLLILEAIKIPLGFLFGVIALFRVMPDVVVGKGGYGAMPVVFAAWFFRIPIVLHESDAVPGLSNTIAAWCARAIALSFPESQKNLRTHPRATVSIIGNPVRMALRNGSYERAQKRFHLTNRPVILVLGGSQGAQELNNIIFETAPDLLRVTEVILQCGSVNVKDLEALLLQFRKTHPKISGLLHIEGFLQEESLADAYKAATIVVSRAGASTIFENLLLAKPAILIPLQTAARGHQEANARAIVHAGAARLILPENLTGHIFLQVVQEVLGDSQELMRMADYARQLARPDAARDFAELIAATVATPKF